MLIHCVDGLCITSILLLLFFDRTNGGSGALTAGAIPLL